MRKGFVVILATLLVAAFALPAMADVNLNGFVRIKPMLSNMKDTSGGYFAPVAGTDNGNVKRDYTNSYVDQRGRFKFTVGDENVKAVAFFESDFKSWGTGSYQNGARNQGAAIMADSIQLETKNVYIWFKVPNTPLDLTVGVQGYADTYQGAFLNAATDLAGVVGNFKMEPVAFRFGFAKLYEGSTAKADDTDLFFVEAKFSPVKDAKIGVNLHFLHDGGAAAAGATSGVWVPNEIANKLQPSSKATTHLYMPGVDFAAKVGPATLSGFLVGQFGDVKSAVAHDNTHFDKIKFGGYAADLRADIGGVLPGNLFVEFLYGSGDDKRSDDKYQAFFNGQNLGNGAAGVNRTDMFILLQNADDITTNNALAYDMGNGGAGIIHIAAGYTQKLMDKLTGKVGLGWAQAAKTRQHDVFGTGENFANKKNIGTEVNAVVKYNIAKGLDFDLVAAYAWLGDGFKPTSGTSTFLKDPDNLYDFHGRLNYAF